MKTSLQEGRNRLREVLEGWEVRAILWSIDDRVDELEKLEKKADEKRVDSDAENQIYQLRSLRTLFLPVESTDTRDMFEDQGDRPRCPHAEVFVHDGRAICRACGHRLGQLLAGEPEGNGAAAPVMPDMPAGMTPAALDPQVAQEVARFLWDVLPVRSPEEAQTTFGALSNVELEEWLVEKVIVPLSDAKDVRRYDTYSHIYIHETLGGKDVLVHLPPAAWLQYDVGEPVHMRERPTLTPWELLVFVRQLLGIPQPDADAHDVQDAEFEVIETAPRQDAPSEEEIAEEADQVMADVEAMKNGHRAPQIGETLRLSSDKRRKFTIAMATSERVRVTNAKGAYAGHAPADKLCLEDGEWWTTELFDQPSEA